MSWDTLHASRSIAKQLDREAKDQGWQPQLSGALDLQLRQFHFAREKHDAALLVMMKNCLPVPYIYVFHFMCPSLRLCNP
ncbi:unnamed protein product [Chrysoparadoxa australica]